MEKSKTKRNQKRRDNNNNNKNNNRCEEGKEKLRNAILNQNVEGVRDALLFLSTTALARPLKEQDDKDPISSSNNNDNNNNSCGGGARNCYRNHSRMEINTNHPDFYGVSAAIGPGPVHTEMVRCFLVPQTRTTTTTTTTTTLRSETTADSTMVVVVVTTNAREAFRKHSDDLARACAFQNLGLVRLLLENGADPNIPGSTKRLQGVSSSSHTTPLTTACLQENQSLARLFLEHGADPNICGSNGLTPLIRMSRLGNLGMVKLLLLPPENDNENDDDDENDDNDEKGIAPNNGFHKNQWGTNVYHYDQQSMNALIHACAENHEPVVRFLAKSSSSSRTSPRSFVSSSSSSSSYVNDYRVDPALWYASARGNASIVRFLMDDCGAVASYRKDPAIYSSTPLEEACQWGHVSTVRVLLERSGSDPRSPSGQKARTQAERSGHSEVVKLLDAWRDRLEGIEATIFQLALLPLLLSLRTDSAHRILCNHVNGLCCYYNHNHSCRLLA